MKLQDIEKIIKINWNNFYIQEDNQSSLDSSFFEITPTDFLQYAKDDYKIDDKKSMINALSNSKRAIDCQCDYLLSYFGFDYLKFDKKHYACIEPMINQHKVINIDSTLKLKFINALGASPILLISKIRELRNKLEHNYTLPDNNETNNAVELAELFINATTYKCIYNICTDYYIENEYSNNFGKLPNEFIAVHIKLNYLNTTIKVCAKSLDNYKEIIINPKDIEYGYLLKASITHDYSYLVRAFNKDINMKYINYKISNC